MTRTRSQGRGRGPASIFALDSTLASAYNLTMTTTLSDSDVRANLSENIRRLLADRGWNQSHLSRLAGENHATISRIINGKQMPTAGIVARIAEAFDASADRLLQAPPKRISVEKRKPA